MALRTPKRNQKAKAVEHVDVVPARSTCALGTGCEPNRQAPLGPKQPPDQSAKRRTAKEKCRHQAIKLLTLYHRKSRRQSAPRRREFRAADVQRVLIELGDEMRFRGLQHCRGRSLLNPNRRCRSRKMHIICIEPAGRSRKRNARIDATMRSEPIN